jgi:hypothetical protein
MTINELPPPIPALMSIAEVARETINQAGR